MPINAESTLELDGALVCKAAALLHIDSTVGDFSAERWMLPIRDGGMGLCSAYLSSAGLFMTTLLKSIHAAVDRYGHISAETLADSMPHLKQLVTDGASMLAQRGATDTPSIDPLLAQPPDASAASQWRQSACSRYSDTFESGTSDFGHLSRKDSGGPGAGSWLLPPTQPQHKLSDQAFVTAARVRLCLPVFTQQGPCLHGSLTHGPCGCSRDIIGIHALHCHVGGQSIARHNHMVKLLARIVEEHNDTPATIEQQAGVHEDLRRPDLVFQDWRGSNVFVDVGICSPYARYQGNARHMRAGAMQASAEAVKRRKYPGINIVPANTGVCGRSGKDFVTLVRSLCRHADPLQRSQHVSDIWKQWSCMLQKWNCHVLATAGELIGP